MDKHGQQREEELERLKFEIEKGIEHEAAGEQEKALEHYERAGRIVSERYGASSPLNVYIGQFDYIKEYYAGEYKAAILKLADAGNLLESFSEKDAVDGITGWILENREAQLKETIAKTWNVYQFFQTDFSIEKVVFNAVMGCGDVSGIVNSLLFDGTGLPHRFGYLVNDILESVRGINQQGAPDVRKALRFMAELQNTNFQELTEEQKKEKTIALINYMEDLSKLPLGNGGFAQYMQAACSRNNFLAAKGMMKLDDSAEAERLLNKFTGRMEDLTYVEDQVRIQLLTCCLREKQQKHEEAVTLLQEVLECEEELMLKLFTIKREQKNEYLKAVGDVWKLTLHSCLRIMGIKAAYKQLLRLRTLAADCAAVKLDGAEANYVGREMLRLEQARAEGRDVGAQIEKLHRWFDDSSRSIFAFEPRDVCHKLNDRQAVIEFARAENEWGKEYYLVFLVFSGKISVVVLEECEQADVYLEELSSYMTAYSVTRYSAMQLRQLPAYRRIYERVWKPIGEMLPTGVRSLYIVPEGGFCRLSFEVFPCFDWYDKYLGEEYDIYYLNSGRELLEETEVEPCSGRVVIGAPDFGGSGYPALPGSLSEVKRVAAILGAEPYTGLAAVPGVLSKPAGILHISTHSYFDEALEGSPMLKTGLVFAGGQTFPAWEISKLKLHGTGLAVLSVCNEGKEEGAWTMSGPGIRRAFAIAGVRRLLWCLWRMDDYAACLFMECFYTFLVMERRQPWEALKNARLYLKERTVGEIRKGPYYYKELEAVLSLFGEEDKPYAHPYYWAGFVLYGC